MCSSSSPREVLPTNVKPLHYAVQLEPVFDGFTFNGLETIEVLVQEPSSTITLHVLELEISHAAVNGVPVTDIRYDAKDQTATFHLSDTLAQGATAKLEITFTGVLNDQMAGFYRSSYQENGATKYLATTQFEPLDCRRAFPAFDEPALKATFAISLIAHRDLTCLSNMDVKDTTLLDGDRKLVAFNTTPLMSTYLVAFIVGDLKSVSNSDYRVPVNVYTTPGSEHLGHYAADITAKTLKFFDGAFDIPYPLPKCDLVAIHDFAAGAMENYGLITFRTVELLLDPKKSNVNTLRRVTEVIMHELAHQWFGNLVTMDFWDGLWLNEGFATWMSWYACNTLYPEWKVWEAYVSEDLQQALSLDGLRSSHPIEVPMKRAEEVNQIFDAISYSKGSSLLKMISKWLGEETFVKGVSNYLKKHKWGNTKTSDLWDALSAVSGKNVTEVMDIWTKNVGYPVVTVKELGNNEIEVTQHRFLTTGDVKPEEDELLYPVFLALKTSSGVESSLVLDSRSKTFKLDIADDFFKINGDQAGIYRTSYASPDRWTKLSKAGLEGKLSVEDRVGLVADAGSLSTSGFIPTTSLLSLVKSWSSESNYVVWDEILARLGTIKGAFIFAEDSVTSGLKTFTRELIDHKLKEVGYTFSDSDSFADQQLKASLFGTAAANENDQVVSAAKEYFQKFVDGDKTAIHSNIRGSVFNTAAKYGDAATFDQLLNIYKNPQNIEEKLDALRALGRFTDPEIIDKTLASVLDFDLIKKQDSYLPLMGLRTHKNGIEKAWAWFTKNYDTIIEAHPPSLSMFGSIVVICSAGFTQQRQKDEVEAFFKGKDLAGFDQKLAQSLDMITSKISWSTRDLSSVTEWLNANGYSKSKL